ncbi:hypothetical protein [Schlesneria sp. T3-172]|uniref:hypothetical protein n=1 Tax=Schlesneria sphaerica TaxID=3373610 RepID=UPI0037CB75F7
MERPPETRTLLLILPVLLVLVASAYGETDSAAGLTSSVEWLTGARYRHELEQPFSGSWTSVEYRALLKDIGADRQIAIVIDRRVDPSVELPIDVTTASLRTGLLSIARHADADVSFPDNVVYIGPRQAARKLRTLIEQRELEVQSRESGIARGRRSELLKHQTFTSRDLETPREVLDRFSQSARITVSNADLIPHDLWAGMTLPDVSVVEALSVVLIQFDLTFGWREQGASIELLPVPETVAVERKHRSRQKRDEALEMIRSQLPRVDAQLVKTDIVVKGTVEDQEAVAGLLRGEPVGGSTRIEAPKPLREQQFSLEASGVPVLALMKKLEESAVTFEYDEGEFLAAGIDLQQKVEIKVRKVSADDFFKQIFEPIGVQFQIEQLTVKLKPKPPQ